MSGHGRVLCSHLVRLRLEGSAREPEWANLEEIDAFGALVASQIEYPTQIEVRVQAKGLDAPGFIQTCRQRENDFALSIEFVDGFRWSEALWRPDHILAPPAEKARGAQA